MLALACAAAALDLAGCVSQASGPGLRPAAAARLHTALAEVRAAADAHQPTRAQRALDSFAREVGAQRASGALSTAQSLTLSTGILQSRRRLSDELRAYGATAAAAAPAATVPSPTPSALSPGEGNGHAKTKGNGHSKDQGPGGDNGGGGD